MGSGNPLYNIYMFFISYSKIKYFSNFEEGNCLLILKSGAKSWMVLFRVNDFNNIDE